MLDNTLENFKRWNDVYDYESDERTVTLLGKNQNPLAKFSYPKFTAEDFAFYLTEYQISNHSLTQTLIKMEEKEILEGNKLISVFMGGLYKPTTTGMFGSWEHFEFPKYTFDSDYKKMDELQYHLSWDWLMPVCRKFKDLDLFQHNNWSANNKNIEDSIIDEYDILQTFAAVVAAINWYNSLTPKQ